MPGSQSDKQCGETPHGTLSMFFQGMTEGNISLMKHAIADAVSGFGIFGNGDWHRGREVVSQIASHPEVSGEAGSCACSPLTMTKTSDPNVWNVVVLRKAFVGEDMRSYTRLFKVTFESDSNCIFRIDTINPKWERM